MKENEERISAVVIDDSSIARKTLIAELIEACPFVNVVAEAENVIDAAKIINTYKPDIIFLDIHLNHGTGFDVLEIIPDHNSNVIFTTGSDQHAIKAFQFSAIDYLLKPIDGEQLLKAVSKVIKRQEFQETEIGVLRSNINGLSKLSLHTAEQIKVVEIDDIARLESMGNYTTFYFTDGSKLLVTKTLKEYDIILSGMDFLRVHQSHLINMKHLDAYIKSEGGYIKLLDGSRVPVSVRKKSSVMDAIDSYVGRREL